MRISDWSSDVCSSDLGQAGERALRADRDRQSRHHRAQETRRRDADDEPGEQEAEDDATDADAHQDEHIMDEPAEGREARSEEHTSELQLLMRISYAVFCLKKKKANKQSQQP